MNTHRVKANNWIVAQLGARMHYAVPRILYAAGLLERLFTDLCVSKGWPRFLLYLPPPLRSASVTQLLSRNPEGIPPSFVSAFTDLGFEYARSLRATKSPGDVLALFLRNDTRFCQHVNASYWGNADALYTFNNAGLETLQLARARGLMTVTEQTIAPKEIECRLLAEQQTLFPDWQIPYTEKYLKQYCERQQQEWEISDLIICGSEFVRDGIRECRGPAEKCVIIPYGVDMQILRKERVSDSDQGKRNHSRGISTSTMSAVKNKRRPLRVLTVGSVGLRKGAPYVYNAAKLMQGQAVFRWVGGIELLPDAARRMSEYIELTGSVPRTDIYSHFEWADVFLLPSICEGSATVCYEALAYGLPVICTPNTGSIVSNEFDGFIIPPFEVSAIVERLELLLADRNRIEVMSENARRQALNFTVMAYGKRLLEVLVGVSTEA